MEARIQPLVLIVVQQELKITEPSSLQPPWTYGAQTGFMLMAVLLPQDLSAGIRSVGYHAICKLTNEEGNLIMPIEYTQYGIYPKILTHIFTTLPLAMVFD